MGIDLTYDEVIVCIGVIQTYGRLSTYLPFIFLLFKVFSLSKEGAQNDWIIRKGELPIKSYKFNLSLEKRFKVWDKPPKILFYQKPWLVETPYF